MISLNLLKISSNDLKISFNDLWICYYSFMIACGMMPNVLVEVKILESLVNLDVMIFN